MRLPSHPAPTYYGRKTMDLIQLQAMGAIVSRTLHKKEIRVRYQPLKPAEQWADPNEPEEQAEFVEDTLTVHIRKKASADFIEMVRADDRDKPFIAIFRCVCREDGSPLFTSLEQTMQIKEWLAIPLISAVNEVNLFGPKNSPPRTSSGAKSRSPSAAARSKSGSKRSVKKSAPSGLPTANDAAP